MPHGEKIAASGPDAVPRECHIRYRLPAQGGETGEGEDDPSTDLPSEYAVWNASQEDGQEAADEDEGEAEGEAAEAEDADGAEEEIYA